MEHHFPLTTVYKGENVVTQKPYDYKSHNHNKAHKTGDKNAHIASE